jgi:hypothetical protein
MSSVSPLRSASAQSVPGSEHLETWFLEPARVAGFWSAVALPFVLLALIVAGVAFRQVGLFTGLLGANLVALRLGRNHNCDY